MHYSAPRLALCLLVALACGHGFAAESAERDGAAADDAESAGVLPGHSLHGDYLNEGPRQQARLMGGTGAVRFPVTTSNEAAGNFIEQGVGQLYGYWYLEAERSFRQAAMLDPECAMAYWGAALATSRDEKRCRGFLDRAVELKEKVTKRERMYIEALDAYVRADKAQKKKRADKYIEALEKIALEFPDDVEAKAFLALQLYKERRAGNALAVDGLLEQIFAERPRHPAHHFRIHLWDTKKPERALESAAICGQAAPAIAHMWHMPGHIYSRLKRYDDACWQQEASARVDHAQMMRDRLLPDQIHNFAHNNEWLIRNLNHVGRVRDAVALARNMVELPRHPKYNTLKKGSARYGRMRLFETLERYELWEEMIALCHSPYLAATDDFDEQLKRHRHLGTASFRSGDLDGGGEELAALRERLREETAARDAAVAGEATEAESGAGAEADESDDAEAGEETTEVEKDAEGEQSEQSEQSEEPEEPAEPTEAAERDDGEKNDAPAKRENAQEAVKRFNDRSRKLEKAIKLLEGHEAVARGDAQAGLPLLRAGGKVDPIYLAVQQLQTGEMDKALDAARSHVKKQQQQVQPLAALVDLLWQAGEQEEARQALEELREISSAIDGASPLFERIEPIAEQLGFGSDWTVPRDLPGDVGDRPELDALGPYRWSPSAAPDWELEDADGTTHALKFYRGKPLLVIFYLGFGCLHCAEQLHAFAPLNDAFNEAGIEIVAISSDEPDDLERSIADYDKQSLPMPLLSDAGLRVFKAYRAFDDFERQPLHGTFLIDPQGGVLWQDISYEPFMEAKFLLRESQRLLGQQQVATGK